MGVDIREILSVLRKVAPVLRYKITLSMVVILQDLAKSSHRKSCSPHRHTNVGVFEGSLTYQNQNPSFVTLVVDRLTIRHMAANTELVRSHLDRLLDKRDYPKTICPSEAARAMSGEEIQSSGAETWRDLMPGLRELSFQLRDQGLIEILQKGQVLSPSTTIGNTTGPIRLRRVRT